MRPRTALRLLALVPLLAPAACSPTLHVEPIEVVLRVDEGGLPVRITTDEHGLPVRTTGDSEMGIKQPSVRYEGVYVSEDLMERVQIGETTGEWILAVIGEPMERSTLSDGTEIWRWEFRPLDTGGPLVGLGGEQAPQPMPIIAYVRLRDGLVIDKFRG